MNLHSELKKIREGKNITLSKLAKELKWPISKLSKIESGNQEITVNELKQLSEALGENINDIIALGENMNVHKKIINSDAKTYRSSLSEKFKEFIVNYNSVSRENFANNNIVKIITKEIPNAIIKGIDMDFKKFLVKGSAGNGQPAEIPWVSIFARDITVSATKGLYLVFLVKADFSGMYLSLNQGFTYFKDKYGTKEGKIKARKASEEVRNLLTTMPEDSIFDIDLKCSNSLGKGYEAANIAAKYYSIDNMPNSSEIIEDIKTYIIVCEELKGNIGYRTVEQFYDYLLLKEEGYEVSEEEEKEAIDEVLASTSIKKPEARFKSEKKNKKDSIIDNKGKKVYPRDSKISANSLEIADYKCEVDETHHSFTRRSNGKNYTESHHLIPINCQDDFEYSLDVEENICSICSTCHNCLHYGIDKERIALLEILYKERKHHLDNVGLNVSFEELKKYYKIGD